MSKKDFTKGVITNIVFAATTSILMILILKVSINFSNFLFFFLVSIITFILGHLIFLMK